MQILFLSLGILSTLLGFIGVFVPLLPTTPFVILAAFFFERGSPTFHSWLIENKYLGPFLKDWQQHKRIRRKYKVLAVCMILVGVSVPLSRPSMPLELKALVVFVIIGVVSFIVTRNEKPSKFESKSTNDK
ncbi:MAG: YbaN family protein [Bdellovibrionota bacterium]|nr:YbaN family protein [Bdellovibrionota bacterium]